MSILDEAILEEKFEKNVKIFKKLLYITGFFAVLLIVYAAIIGYYNQLTYDYNRRITLDILNNSVNISQLTKDSPINSIALFKHISKSVAKNIDENALLKAPDDAKKADFKTNVIDNLELLQNNSDVFIKTLAYDYMGKLILDHPQYFDTPYIISYMEKIQFLIDQTINSSINDQKKNTNQVIDFEKFDGVSNLILIKGIWLKNNKSEFLDFYTKARNYFQNDQHYGKITEAKNVHANSVMLILDLYAKKYQ